MAKVGQAGQSLVTDGDAGFVDCPFPETSATRAPRESHGGTEGCGRHLVMRIVHSLTSRVIVELLESRHSGATVELRAATALLVAIVLAEMGREEA